MWTVIAAIAVSGLLSVLTDWLFMGLLFRTAYDAHPEIWRSGLRERGAAVWSGALGLVMSAGVVALVAVAGAGTPLAGAGVGFLAWLAGPLVVSVVTGLLVKIDTRITVANCLGTLARMAVAGAVAGLMLPLA